MACELQEALIGMAVWAAAELTAVVAQHGVDRGAVGYLAMGGQIVDVTVVQARRPRLTEDEKATVKGGDVPDSWSQAKRAQMDTDGRWTIKRGRRRRPGEGESQARVAAEIAVPVFGYKNHLGIDRRHGFIRTFTVTDAASHDGRQLGKLLDPATPRARSGPTPPITRPPTSGCWRGAA
jgi:hypothetical protein